MALISCSGSPDQRLPEVKMRHVPSIRKCVCSVIWLSNRNSWCFPLEVTCRTVTPVRSVVASAGTRNSQRVSSRPVSTSCRRRHDRQTVSPSGTLPLSSPGRSAEPTAYKAAPRRPIESLEGLTSAFRCLIANRLQSSCDPPLAVGCELPIYRQFTQVLVKIVHTLFCILTTLLGVLTALTALPGEMLVELIDPLAQFLGLLAVDLPAA